MNPLVSHKITKTQLNEIIQIFEIECETNNSKKDLKFIFDKLKISYHKKSVEHIKESIMEGIEIKGFDNLRSAYLTPNSILNILELVLEYYHFKNLINNNHPFIIRFSWDGAENIYKSAHERNYELISIQFISHCMNKIQPQKNFSDW